MRLKTNQLNTTSKILKTTIENQKEKYESIILEMSFIFTVKRPLVFWLKTLLFNPMIVDTKDKKKEKNGKEKGITVFNKICLETRYGSSGYSNLS